MSSLAGFPIADWRRRYGLISVVETGTYLGTSVRAALDAGFERVVSCDICETFVAAVETKFDLYGPRGWRDRTCLYVGPSVDRLPEMLDDVGPRPALLFFDAHVDPALFDGALPPGPSTLPLRQELALVLARRDVAGDVVVVDDLHLCTQERWVGPEFVRDWRLPAEGPPFRSASEIASLFPGHRADVVVAPDPALVLLPRGGGAG